MWKLPATVTVKRNDMQQSTMVTAAPPILVPPGRAPAPAVMPQLPHRADPGTITGWLLDCYRPHTMDSFQVYMPQY
jgi:hypothetical protein